MHFSSARVLSGLAIATVLLASPESKQARAAGGSELTMPSFVEQFTADRTALERVYPMEIASARLERLNRFYSDELHSLDAMDFDHFAHEDQVDYLLLHNLLTSQLHQLAIQQKQIQQMTQFLPFLKDVESLMTAKREMQRPDGEKIAKLLTGIASQIEDARHEFEPSPNGGSENSGSKPQVDKVIANRAVNAIHEISDALHDWFNQYNGYDPLFTWWVDQPYHDVDKALDDYSKFLKDKVIGIKPDDKTTIIGDPVGRDALLAELQDALIPYTPEEMIAIAQTEYDWCMKEMLKASHEMGYGDDWHAAVEKVKTMHVAPGEQPDLIRDLVEEGSDFVKKNDLVTVPPLADETWRMIMMTPQRQLVNPFFTGGSQISVSYPTDTMTFDQREMSMRGNNIPFAHATAFHEMIPGHFLQSYMASRHHVYRRPFSTPFWVEGNAFYWEMVFWDKGFERTPEERVGALVWRMHRSARVIFTMNFHLGKWTPEQCVKFLIDAVGFEPDNATAEVRRSFDGSVGPLYQCAYLMGALQFRALRHELVDSKKMTERQFHDAILHENAMPVEILRTDLENLKLTRDYESNWEFYGPHPTHP